MPRGEQEAAEATRRKKYLGFWEGVGTGFPSLKKAISTGYYRECEISVVEQFFPRLDGASVVKTDLWDEAKNTEILVWMAEKGAWPLGVDLSYATAREAASVAAGHRPGFAKGDVRQLPFADGSVDYVYSMGTVEHFPETEHAIGEIFRILKPGGRAVLGVPNRLDPFLRPVYVRMMQWVGLYGYGAERSFTPGQLRRMARRAGFRVIGLSGVLFLPGWLRMLELLAHSRGWRRTATFLGRCSAPFRFSYLRWPAVRRHGYLLALGVERPE